MKRGKIFKYSIFMFVLLASFFIFSKASVNAEEIIVNENLSFSVEEVEGNYLISSVNYSCSGSEEECSIETLTIPDEYNGSPIIGIKDGSVVTNTETATNTFYGTLDGLKNVKISKIVTGKKLQTVGKCAFCNLDVDSIFLSSSVISVGERAFANSSVTKVYFNRYDTLSVDNVFTTVDESTFYEVENLKYIVFSGATSYIQHKDNSDVWKDLSVSNKYTYEFVYKYYDGGQYVGEMFYYYGFTLGELYRDLSREGFDFLGWYYTEEGPQVSIDDKPNSSLSVIAKWQLKALDLDIQSFVKGEENPSNKMLYNGKNSKMDIEVFAEVVDEIEDYTISYAWDVNLSSGAYEMIESNRSNLHSVSFVGESGVYNCYVTLHYAGYTREHKISIDVTIEKRDVIVTIGKATVTYGTYVTVDDFEIKIENNATAFANGESLKEFEFKGFTNNNGEVEVGLYEDALKIELSNIGYEDDNASNYISNYNIIYNYGDLEVVKLPLSIGFLAETKVIEYGDNENLTAHYSKVVYQSEENPDGIGKILEVTYFRKDPDKKEVNIYKIDRIEVNDSKNFDVSLDSDEYVFVINPKQVDVVWGDSDFIYDGEEKQVSAHYVGLENDIPLVVNISQGGSPASLINAGLYLASVDLTGVNENYSLNITTKNIIIEKADTYFIEDSEQAVTYNGLVREVKATPNHNEYEVVNQRYMLGQCKGATTSGNPCKIEVSVAETDNYKAYSEVFSLYINKATVYVTPDEFEITYGVPVASRLLQYAEGVNNEQVKVKFQTYGESSWDVGYYSISGVECMNYSDVLNYIVLLKENTGLNKIKIVPSPLKVRFYFYENLVYTGEVFDIGVRLDGIIGNDIVDIHTFYDGDKVPKNAGTYILNTSIDNENYYIDGASSLTFEIEKANYDVSNLSLKDKKVSFNFKVHSLLLEGNLPSGLRAKYSIDGKAGNGTLLPFKHTVKVTFEGDFDNFNYVEPMVATLNISIISMLITVISTVALLGCAVAIFVYLVKSNKIRFTKRIKRKVFRRIIKKNRALDEVNEIIITSRDSKKVEEEVPFIEENVRFAKTEPIKVNTEIVSKSFVDELFRAEPTTKAYYSELKNELLSYVGVSSKIKRDYETFYLNNLPIARLDIENGILYAFYSLDPSVYNKNEYKHEDVSKKREFGVVPMKLAVTSLDSLRHAKMFVRIIRKRENIKSVSNFVRVDYARVYTVKEGSLKMFKKVFLKKKKGEFEEE